jgi:hypothetical protein
MDKSMPRAAETLVDPIADDLSAELDAMRAIGAALARVHDPLARARVLRWAAERFQTPPIAAAAALPLSPLAMPALVDDPTLGVETLHELFDAPVEDDLHEMLELPKAVAPHAADASDSSPAPRKPREEPARLDALVRGFAAEFQRLAIEWQRA